MPLALGIAPSEQGIYPTYSGGEGRVRHGFLSNAESLDKQSK